MSLFRFHAERHLSPKFPCSLLISTHFDSVKHTCRAPPFIDLVSVISTRQKNHDHDDTRLTHPDLPLLILYHPHPSATASINTHPSAPRPAHCSSPLCSYLVECNWWDERLNDSVMLAVETILQSGARDTSQSPRTTFSC